MPLYMDTHRNVADLTREAVEGAHQADLATQEQYGVDYEQYWYITRPRVPCTAWSRPRTPRQLLRCIAKRTVWWRTTSLRFTKATEASELIP
jgi:hypothetical protein